MNVEIPGGVPRGGPGDDPGGGGRFRAAVGGPCPPYGRYRSSGASGPPGPRDQAEAAGHCEELLGDTLDAVRPELLWRSGESGAGARLPLPECDPGGPGVQWYVSRSREIATLIATGRRAVLLDMVELHWRRRGSVITSVNAELSAIRAVTRYGYQLTLCFDVLGGARLVATSPGVARSAVLPRPVDGPAAPAEPPGMAQVRCSFWTAFD
ncbi:hypothetical protein ACWEQL_36535 [Kitasatospora sp. NPDC004240]